ncbi:hypothetical protein BDW66DRAFT_125664 [Aspergillus desertorum]
MLRTLTHPLFWAFRSRLGRPASIPLFPGATNSTARMMDAELEMEVKPYTYTSGRCFVALCQKVIELCPEANHIKACRKIEGGFNRVFIFTLDNEKAIVARLPFRLAGPAKLTTLSEAATIRYLQTKTNIPIPRRIIIMKHATGVLLHEKWHKMAGDQQVRCIDAIYRTMKNIVDLEFPAFGSIYFDDTLGPASKQPLGDGFCVGPHCGTRYWDTNVGERRYYHYVNRNTGPWLTLGEYCDGLIDAGLSQVPAVDIEPKRPIYHGSPEAHLALLNTRISNSAAPLLFHSDLHMRNIFVSDDNPSAITSIIDWQAASIEPAFWYSDEVPDFAVGSEICAKAFDLSSQFFTPKLAGPRLMNGNIFRPFRYCYRTWKDGAALDELGFEGQCPFPLPTRDELGKQQKEYRLFEAVQNLRTDLASLLNTASDGWVPPDGWKAAQSAQKELFDGMLQAVLTNAGSDDDEPVRDEMTLRSIWPFDIDGRRQ